MAAQGHIIIVPALEEGEEESKAEPVDFNAGPDCWYMTDQHSKYLPDAVKMMRQRKYVTKPKKEKINGKA